MVAQFNAPHTIETGATVIGPVDVSVTNPFPVTGAFNGAAQSATNPAPEYTPGGLQTISAVLTRPANTTAYTQYDLIADSTSAAAATPFLLGVRVTGECVRLERLRIRSSNALAKTQQIRAHVWRAAPTLNVNDNGIFNASGGDTLQVADITGHVGTFDVQLTYAGTAGASGAGVPLVGGAMTFSPTTGTTFYVTYELRTAAGYTPLSGETLTGTFEGQWS